MAKLLLLALVSLSLIGAGLVGFLWIYDELRFRANTAREQAMFTDVARALSSKPELLIELVERSDELVWIDLGPVQWATSDYCRLMWRGICVTGRHRAAQE